MKHLLTLGILALILAPQALAAEEAAAAPPVETQAALLEPSRTAVEAEVPPTPFQELQELYQIFGGPPLVSALAAEEPQQLGLCVICPLSYCRRQGLRCNYLNCDQQTCCSYSCFSDPSCTSGNPNCALWDCRCQLQIEPL